MLKKLIALAVTSFFALNASAGYVQYDLSYGPAGSGLSGFFIQHDDDRSIAFFSFSLNDPRGGYGQQFHPFTGEGAVSLTSASTYFRNGGPTNFTIHDSFGADHFTNFSVTFARTTQGNFTYTAQYTADLWANLPPRVQSGTVSGIATKGTVNPLLVNELDMYGGYYQGVPRIIPKFINSRDVPEPASLGLLALGAAGLAGASRRRKPAK